ncbi:MAG: hypothetical protein ACRYG5_09950 [Janthinobacterium lividum]
MSEIKDWKHAEEWTRSGKDFLVKVYRSSSVLSTEWAEQFGRAEVEHKWAVYAYIYPKHPHFGAFNGEEMFQDAANIMPLHAGCSFLRFHYSAPQTVCSIEAGADYSHLHDDAFLGMATPEEARRVFHDADELFDRLRARATQGGAA